ncbi:hypothetical protein GGI04_000584 [Coemansia thaxteri]|uniref:Uncharacterized protein n=1 Tax=Coemansia thaxteri TaxID=2663907 RepID=A0A9W8BGW3_9FUNG|nr:hypothetical protein H4R26_000871 [Coemansia thaxteri]KAJ2009281.1 hypothetical protein GGI04_000584 [Coemansia thaxteri]KAJ2487152.1 hypothetical protein EV174_000694 [Coemansia sp. RSA 2320]
MLPDSSAQKPSTKRKSLNPPDSNGVKRRKKQRRVLSLPKSASEIPHSAGNDDVDSGAELDSLKVPGELVMALYLRKYYPARVLSRPAHNRFEIEFFDGKKATMSRGRFYTVYEPKFCTCPMGAIQLIGDEPARGLVGGAEAGASQDINPERDFERDCKLCPWLIVSMEKLRHHLDALHNCTADMLDEMAKVEDRMAAFFGHDASAKRMLPLRISPGFLNRAEFDFLGRLLCRWYTDPPSAIRQAPPQCDHELTATASSDDAPPTTQASDPACSQSKPKPADEDFREGSESSHSTEPIDRSATPKPATSNEAQDKMDMTDLGASAMAIKFIHEVLLPHAIKRMIVEREDCSLEAAEERMCRGDTEVRWVDQILAARGNMQS